MTRAKPTTLDLGSVSTGTLRTEDLLPAVLTALDPRWIHLSRAERASPDHGVRPLRRSHTRTEGKQ